MPAAKRSVFRFKGRLESFKRSIMSTVIFLPEDVVKALPKGRVRVEGTFNKAPFALAVQNEKDGGRLFTVSKALQKEAGIKPGDSVDVTFKLIDPEKLELPEELEAVLAQDAQGKKYWDAITTGLKRSLIHYITSVKNVDTRIKRALFLVDKVKTGVYDPEKRKKARH